MKDKTEWNRLKLDVDLGVLQQMLDVSEDPVLQFHRQLPLVTADVRIIPKSFHCESPQTDDIRSLKGSAEITVQHPDWNVRFVPYLTIQGRITEDIFRWTDAEIVSLEKLTIEPETEFQIDGHSVHLVPTLNKIIALNLPELLSKVQKALPVYFSNLSEKYFGSQYLVELLDKLFFKVETNYFDQHIELAASASELKNHFVDAIDIPPYFFIEMPVAEFQYFLSHAEIPPLEVRGYSFIISSVEVVGDNILLINLQDARENVNVALQAALKLKDNILYPEVITLDIDGLGWFHSTMFKILKKMIVRQIENKSFDISSRYRSLQAKLARRYPFLRIQDGKELVLRKLDINSEGLSLFVHFPEDQLS